jgi:hypothetical protein
LDFYKVEYGVLAPNANDYGRVEGYKAQYDHLPGGGGNANVRAPKTYASTEVVDKSGLKCPYCGQPYVTTADLQLHIQRRHGAKPLD